MTTNQPNQPLDPLFAGPGEARARCRAIDWSATPLGPVARWPACLRLAVRICLNAPFPMIIWAGPELVLIHNDFRPMLSLPDRPWVLGHRAREVWPEVCERLAPELEKVFQRGESIRHREEPYVVHRGGPEEAFFTYSLDPIQEEDGRVVGALSVFVESTESVRPLSERTALLRAISDSSQDRIFAKDRSGRMLFANPAMLALVGKPAERVLGKTDLEFLDDQDAARRIMESDRQVMDSGTPSQLEEQVPLPDGTRSLWHSLKAPHRDATGRVIGLFSISRDITDRKRVEESAREHEARYRTLFESIDEGLCIVEALFDDGRPIDFRFLEVNPAFEKSGIQNTVGRRIREILPDLEDYWFQAIGQVALTGESIRFQRPAQSLGRFYDVNAFRVGAAEEHRVAILFNDITEAKQTEQGLREADSRKNEFLAVLSHELRNPLAPIRNSVHILERAAPGGAQARRALQVIDRQAQLLSALIEDLLDVTRVTRGKVSLQRERVDLNALARGAAEDHREAYSRGGIDLVFEDAGEPLFVHGDPTRLAQVISNLLSNSVKFTPRGGRTVLTVERSPQGEAVVRVEDNGAGMSPQTLEHLFEPFMQAAQTIERTRGGLGLGPALVKGLVDGHGGKVTAHSDGVGRGSVFTVTLPLLSSAPPQVAAPPALQPGSGPRRVLVVEDNLDAAETLRDLLELASHEVALAFSGPEGVELAHSFKPDVVLSDIGLPGMDGYGVARALRADPDPLLRSTFLIALSGYALPEDVQKSTEAGFDRHLSKPPSLEDLKNLVAGAPKRAA